MKNILSIFFLTLTSIHTVIAETISEIDFSHKDWQIVCDNTRTCRAAGYQNDSDELPVSVLLTRKAGVTSITAELMIGDTIEGEIPSSVEMTINNQSFGNIILNHNPTHLSSLQTDALLKSLTKTSDIQFINKQKKWHLSDQGASAVLLKMDEFQGRLDTPGALIRKGNKTEKSLPVELAVPVIMKGTTIDNSTNDSYSAEIINSINQSIGTSDCDLNEEESDQKITIYPLTEKHWLVSRSCWLAAYNAGSIFWLVNAKAPHNPTFITDSGTDYENGIISESHKGRGLGDCWSFKSWVWDGKAFVVSEVSTTGMCKMITAGGAWSLPTFVSDVREATK